MQAAFLTIHQIAENPLLATTTVHFEKKTGSEKVLFRPLLRDDIFAVQQFLECLSEATRQYATHPSYDLECAQRYCNEIDHDDILRMVAISEDKKIIALFEFNFRLGEFDIKRYRTYGLELNPISDVQFAPCISDEYQSQHLGTKLLHAMIDLAKHFGKSRLIAWDGVLIDNKQAIRFYEKNNFKIFREKYIASDGYECYDGILELT
ncbi:unnamed protein product [Rotaria socialis]|uniref:N-acetyltransferase domain-containing protein n=1 Tax=Rotaria socialis TaxID=392032 RepID=A0A820D8A3_9BILA|nr:unnamed protein product [Rotaria socialis]CAF3326328.1 unnamed protein product [Rotaria socialis]CAF3437495.1 unnamed protein product [Rotaria socialis]CAF4125599.1 unnamed protein product [Rotaria socialis]CAF4229135.1 unnamed protein product [Rotaria socialis]